MYNALEASKFELFHVQSSRYTLMRDRISLYVNVNGFMVGRQLRPTGPARGYKVGVFQSIARVGCGQILKYFRACVILSWHASVWLAAWPSIIAILNAMATTVIMLCSSEEAMIMQCCCKGFLVTASRPTTLDSAMTANTHVSTTIPTPFPSNTSFLCTE